MIMDREGIKKVLSCPSKPILMIALQLVNLKDKERLAIELVDLRGMTQELASVEMKCSVKTIVNQRKRAYDKMAKAWNNEPIIKEILED